MNLTLEDAKKLLADAEDRLQSLVAIYKQEQDRYDTAERQLQSGVGDLTHAAREMDAADSNLWYYQTERENTETTIEALKGEIRRMQEDDRD